MCPHIKKFESERTRDKVLACVAGAGYVLLQSAAGVANFLAVTGIAGTTMIAQAQILPFVKDVMPMEALFGVHTLEQGLGFVMMGFAGLCLRTAAGECENIYEHYRQKAKTAPVSVPCQKKKEADVSCCATCRFQPAVSL